MTAENWTIRQLIKQCKKGKRTAQRELYRRFYAYSMTVCLHYSNNRTEAQEIVNDGFMKIFRKIDQCNPDQNFKSWLRRILINAAIDYHRKYDKHNLTATNIIPIHEPITKNDAINKLSLDDVMIMVQRLTPAYRLVFNLYAVEGFKHHEIATKLGISEGTSKSNYSKARAKLRKMLEQQYPERFKSKGQ